MTHSRLFAVCPHCNAHTDSRLDHLEVGASFGPWDCDECGMPYGGVFQGADTVLKKREKTSERIPAMVLLEFPPSDKPVRFLLSGTRFRYLKDTDSPEEAENSVRFFYEEHSCPTNWLGEVEMVIFDGDADPHGFLRYVRHVENPALPGQMDCERDSALLEMFPEVMDNTPLTAAPAAR